MQSIASGQAPVCLALNEIFGSKGQVRLLRILALEMDGLVASNEVATRIGLTRSGARKALRRLVATGLVQKTGSGRHTRYHLNRENSLAPEIIRLFETERRASDPGWGREHSRRTSRHPRRRSGDIDGGGNGKGIGNGNGNEAQKARALAALPDPDSPAFHGALASLLTEELSLIRRARERILSELKGRPGSKGQDLWEWRKVLETYPLPRLLHFLESESPRAQRLRRSSPFPDVISDQEKERLAELVETLQSPRMH